MLGHIYMYHISPNAQCTLHFGLWHLCQMGNEMITNHISRITHFKCYAHKLSAVRDHMLTKHGRTHRAPAIRGSSQIELADDLLTENLSNGLRVNGDAANYGRIGRIKGNRWRSYISYPPNVRHPQSTASAPRYQILQHFKLTNGFTGGAMEPPKAKEG